MIDWLLQWGTQVGALLIGVLMGVGLWRERKSRHALESKFAATEVVLRNARQQYESLSKQFVELRTASMGMSDKLLSLSQQLEQVTERQVEADMQDGDGKLYSRASRMVELGADVDELMQECDLPKAEAELLLSLQQKFSKPRRR